MNDNGWGEPLIRPIESTPEDSIIHNQIMSVPTLQAGRLKGDWSWIVAAHLSRWHVGN
jgi:hypothetical protein